MKTVIALVLILLTSHAYGQKSAANLDSELSRLNTQTVLIVNSQAVDEYPLWSPKSDFIACNIQGEWYKFRLTNIELAEASWREQTIGVLTTQSAYSKLTKKEYRAFDKVSVFHPREVETNSGIKVELKIDEGAVSLIVTDAGGEAQTLWKSSGENCHSLVLSPDEKYIAYLCEMNGLFVMQLK